MKPSTLKKLTKKIQPFSYYRNRLALPFVLLSLASYVVIQMTPVLVKDNPVTQQVALWQISLVGVMVIALSALFLAYTARLIGLTRGWLILGVLFSSLIVVTKFILIPQSLYSQTYQINNGLVAFDPNSSGSYIGVAAVLFAAYALILWIAYRHYDRKVALRLKRQQRWAISLTRSNMVNIVVVTIALLILVAVALGGSILIVPMLVFGSTSDYIGFAFSGGGLGLVISTVLAIVLSVKYLEHSSNIAVEAKDGTILAITFWVGLSLLLMYHVLWVVYMTIMLTIWPFQTISPSGK